jgi:deoxyribodipyrimidine photo-lyase
VASIVLFTRDLRVHDHPALSAAAGAGVDVVPLFVLDRVLLATSSNRARFLLESLVDLDRSLARLGSRLVVREGDVVARTLEVARAAGVTAVHITADVSGFATRREEALRAGLAPEGIALHVHAGSAVVEPGEVRPAGKDVYKVFTPFHRAWTQAPRRGTLGAPPAIRMAAGLDLGPRPDPASVTPEAIDLPPGGESAGRRHLDRYIAEDSRRYDDLRNDMAADGTSRMSPYLRFGCVSATEMVARATEVGAGELVRQLAWRDFFGHLLASDPSLQWRDFREPPPDVPEPPADAADLLRRWSDGKTGVPLVDAGMRQLRREGWIHNRARMIVASFLTRRLGVPWQEGAAVFMRLLVDGDPANNAGGWQWVAGTGTDPRRARSFSPVRQAQRFDADGTYIKRYVRELQGVPAPVVFAPWTQPAVLHATGYPSPVIELRAELPSSDPSDPPFRAVAPAPSDQAALPV